MNKTLKKYLIDRNMTMRELAAKIGTTPGYLSEIVNGKVDGFNWREKIAKVLEVSYDVLWMNKAA